ncbi:helix-turn-helix domain-containing protein [Paenibacillus castaneae]|nr:helix-turn-helix domain-containing protein [Paenibacillus castaneae]
MQLSDYILRHPIVPYIRESDFAARMPWVMPVRRLLDYLLVYVQEGTCHFWVEEEKIVLERGDFCFIQPNTLNMLKGITNTVTPFVHMDIFYNPDRELSFPTRAGQIDISSYSNLLQPRLDELLEVTIPIKLPSAITQKIRDPFLTAVEYWQYHSPVMQLRAQASMTKVIIDIMEYYIEDKPAMRTSATTLNWITSYFSYHMNEPISVKDMAARACLSISRFNDLFKRQYGKTPHQYLVDMRVNHACELLQQEDLSQEHIASYCGFSDVHHFSRVFKSKKGVSPGRYRLQQQ